jgi:16S rRNA (uracil1498-N3)-methyltransferase
VRIEGETADQIRRVLRMRPGDGIVLLDGMGNQYPAVLREVNKGEVVAVVGAPGRVETEPRVAVTMYLSLLNKADKFEWALQKCTELGASAFVPLRAHRSMTLEISPSRRERWERIIQEAAEQSERGILPPLGQITQRIGKVGSELAIIPEVGNGRPLAEVLHEAGPEVRSVSLFIGPEGGFEEYEIGRAIEAGVIPVSLGPRILRAETAAVASLAIVMSELGEM